MEKKCFVIVIILWINFKVETAQISDDICLGISKGFLKHPDPSRCSDFILCFLQKPFLFNCTRPNEIFHLPASDCVPGNPDTCEIFTPSPNPTTTPAITTTTPVITTPEITTTTPEITTPEITTTSTPITTTTPVITTPEITTPVITTTSTLIITTTPEITTTTPIITTSTTTEPGPEITTRTVTWDPSSTTTQRPIGPAELCRGNYFRFVADPESCFRFYYCMGPLALPGECAPDRIFSERWRGCVLGDQETCTPDSWITIVTRRP